MSHQHNAQTGCIGENLEDLARRGFLGAGHLRVLNP